MRFTSLTKGVKQGIKNPYPERGSKIEAVLSIMVC
jgi:hypothetical protein